jgi:hypothetical protein
MNLFISGTTVHELTNEQAENLLSRGFIYLCESHKTQLPSCTVYHLTFDSTMRDYLDNR